MKKNSIVLLVGGIGAILAIFVFFFVFLQKDPGFSDSLNVIAITLIIAGVAIALIAAVILAKKNRNNNR